MNTPIVRDFMCTKLVTLNCQMSIYDAIKVLLKNKISGAPVMNEQKRLCGVLSEKDCLRLFANAALHQLPGGKVKNYMTRNTMTISPTDGLFTVVGIFLNNSFRRLPVVEGGKLIGQVSRRDVLEGSRIIWETSQQSPTPKAWTDSKYFSDEVKAALKSDKL